MNMNKSGVARLPSNIVMTLGFCLALGGASSVWSQTFGGVGLPLDVPDNDPAGVDTTFDVSGITTTLNDVSVSVTFNAPHSWSGDVIATISAPGGSPSADLFARIGRVSAGIGDNSNLAGPYVFVDPATAGSSDFWAAAAATSNVSNIPAGTYFTSSANSAAGTPLNAVFTGLTPAQINGTWTLNVSDNFDVDTGTLAAAELILVTSTSPAAPPAQIPTLPIYGLVLTALGLILIAMRRLRTTNRRC